MWKESRSLKSENLRKLWRAHLVSWEKSKLSQANYCRRHRLKVTQFTYWKKKLSTESSPIAFVSIPIPSERLPFIPEASLYLEYRKDYRIRVDKGFDQGTLSRLLETLGGLNV